MTTEQIIKEVVVYQFSTKTAYSRIKNNMMYAHEKLNIKDIKECYRFVTDSTLSLVSSANNIEISKEQAIEVVDTLWDMLVSKGLGLTKLF